MVAAARAFDGILVWAIGSFALWTVAYHIALLLPIDATVVWSVWLAAAVTLAVVLLRFGLPGGPVAAVPARGHLVAAVVGLAAAGLASCLVRPDLDDAEYTVRATWIAARGVLRVGDVIFSDGRLPGLPEETPYLPSFEGLVGMSSHVLGISAGSLCYVVYVPLAAFGAVWATWLLLRTWQVRRPALVLLVSTVFIWWGGPLNASWGNLNLGRIWQGKVTFLAVLVPVVYAWAARTTAATGRSRAWGLAGMFALGIAATGLTPAAVFVVPGILVVTGLAAAVAGAGSAGVLPSIAGSVYPLGAGVVALIVGHTGAAVPAGTGANPWARTIGTGPVALVVALAAFVGLLGLVVPRVSAAANPLGRCTVGTSVAAGVVVGLPVVYGLMTAAMKTDAIVWRAVWVVPVPALVGMLVATARGRWWLDGVVALGTSAVLVAAGTPLWSAANAATLGRPGSWKVAAGDLNTAHWIVGQHPRGRYLARSQVVAAVGTLTADLAPVGTRSDYISEYVSLPEAQEPARALLQLWVDGAVEPGDAGAVGEALRELDVSLVCGAPSIGGRLPAGWSVAYRGADTCWLRGRAPA